MSASPKMPCNTSEPTNTRASTNPSSPATSSSITYAPCRPPIATRPDVNIVECLCRTAAAMACAQPRHIIRLLFHPGQRRAVGALHPRSRRPSTLMGILQLRLWHVDVRKLRYGERAALTVSGTPPWTTSTESKRAEPAHRVRWENFLST
jgi:hypothetical protein